MKPIGNSNKGGDTQTRTDKINVQRGTLFKRCRTGLVLPTLATQHANEATRETVNREKQNGRKTMKHEPLNMKRMKTKCRAISVKNALLGGVMAMLLLVGAPVTLAAETQPCDATCLTIFFENVSTDNYSDIKSQLESKTNEARKMMLIFEDNEGVDCFDGGIFVG